MDWAIRHLPDRGCTVEIGTYGGLSTNPACRPAREHRREHPFFTCGPRVDEGFDDRSGAPVGHVDGRADLSRTDSMRHIKESCIAAVRPLRADRLPRTVATTPAELFALWGRRDEVADVFGRPVADVARHLEPGGPFLLDDSAAGLPFGSVAMVGAILDRGDLEVVARNPNHPLRRR